MTDQVKIEAAMTLTAESMRLAKNVESLLSQILPPKIWDADLYVFRHSPEAQKDPIVFCWLKLAGAVATVVPMCSLMAAGFCFAAVILARSVWEAVLSITFMLPNPNIPDWPNEKQKKALSNFYTEIWDDHLKPYETTKKISQIPLKYLCAAWGNIAGALPGLNPHDMTQTARQHMSCDSNYTHMGYPALMELFREDPVRLRGKESTHAYFTLQHAVTSLNSVCYATSLILDTQVKDLQKKSDGPTVVRLIATCRQQQRKIEAISQRLTTGFGLNCDSTKLLRAMKTGKPIDDLLNPNHSERPTP